MFKEKINRYIQETVQNSECIEAMEDFIESCGSYVVRVNSLEAALITRKYLMESNKYVKYINDLTISRDKAENALIVNMKILNRICTANKIEVPIKCNLENSLEVQNMAVSLVQELYNSRKQ